MVGLEGARVTVTTEELKNKADAVTASINSMNNCMEELDRIIKNTEIYWKGDGANSYRAIYTKNKTQVNEVIKMLKDHPAELMAVAGNYEIKEKGNVSQNENTLMTTAIY